LKENQHDSAGPRPKKEDFLPEIATLAGLGLGAREIAEKVGVSKSSINKWLRELQGKRTKKLLDPAEIIRGKIAYYRSISDKLFEAWRLSQEKKQVQVVEISGPAGDPAAAKQKKSVRTETQTGNPSYLAQAMKAEDKIEILQLRLAELEGTPPSGPGGRLVSIANLTDEELEQLTWDDLESFNDDQLFAISARLHGKHGPAEMPLWTAEELRNMSDEELTALEFRLGGGIKVTGPGEQAGQPQRLALDGSQVRPHTEPTETEPAGTAPAAGTLAESPKKVEAPRLTWAQQHQALVRAEEARRRKRKRYTAPLWDRKEGTRG
jgi:transcriptional regulator with XRE-family HTH domain